MSRLRYCDLTTIWMNFPVRTACTLDGFGSAITPLIPASTRTAASASTAVLLVSPSQPRINTRPGGCGITEAACRLTTPPSRFDDRNTSSIASSNSRASFVSPIRRSPTLPGGHVAKISLNRFRKAGVNKSARYADAGGAGRCLSIRCSPAWLSVSRRSKSQQHCERSSKGAQHPRGSLQLFKIVLTPGVKRWKHSQPF